MADFWAARELGGHEEGERGAEGCQSAAIDECVQHGERAGVPREGEGAEDSDRAAGGHAEVGCGREGNHSWPAHGGAWAVW